MEIKFINITDTTDNQDFGRLLLTTK